MMTRQIYNELMGHDTEWIRAFFELVKVFKEMNNQRGGGSHDVR